MDNMNIHTDDCVEVGSIVIPKVFTYHNASRIGDCTSFGNESGNLG